MSSRLSRILVVDDSELMRKIVCSMLRGLGLENVDEASDGLEALHLLSLRYYTLVISDWNMQPMNGLELLASLKSSNVNSRVPFIMMTAHVVKFGEVAPEGGTMHLLKKPFTREALAAKLESIVTQSLASPA